MDPINPFFYFSFALSSSFIVFFLCLREERGEGERAAGLPVVKVWRRRRHIVFPVDAHSGMPVDGREEERDGRNSSGKSLACVTTGNHPTGVPDVRVLFLVPGGKVHQKLIHYRV